MARKHYSEMTPERKKELRKQYRNPPTREYQQMRVLRVALLCLALLCAFAASPISFVPEAYRFAFVVIGNLLVLAAILLDVFKMRSMREEYIDENLNKNRKEATRAQKAYKQRLKEEAAAKVSLEEQLMNDEELSYWEKLKLRAKLSAQEAQKDPRE
ncbi:MAG: hypothetical protein PUD81_04735 [Eggerthellales bacterium]|nr:hypothetical protein [Eggerthellales bacterium]